MRKKIFNFNVGLSSFEKPDSIKINLVKRQTSF